MIDCNIDAEKSVLGAIMSNNDVITELDVEASDFCDGSTRCIFKTMLDIYNSGKPIDMITLVEALKDNGKIDLVGGLMYLADIDRFSPHIANVKYHASIMKDLTLRRKLKDFADALMHKANDYEEINEAVDEAQRDLLNLTEKSNSKDAVPMSEAAETYAQNLIELDGKPPRGVITRFSELDNIIGGFKEGDLVIIAARPAMGKTAFALNIAQNVSRTMPVLFVSLEMSEEQLTGRLFKSQAGMMRLSLTGDGDFLKMNVERVKTSVQNLQLHIYDNSIVTIRDIRRNAMRIKRHYGSLGIICIDYIQLMKAERRSDSRVQEVSELTRSLKVLARELKVPIIALSQLNRSVEMRADKRPMLSDLRESGSIEQDADVVIMLHRESYYEADNDDGETEIIIAKHRAGPVGTVKLFYKADQLRFVQR